MDTVTLYEKSGLTITVKGDFTSDELEILRQEVRATILDILKFRKYGREGTSK